MTTATKCGVSRRFYPILPIEDLCYAFQQDYEILRNSFAPTPLNTVSPDDASAFLQEESALSDINGEIVRWTRTYFQIPPSWDDWENGSYTFPQTPGYIVLPSGSAGLIGRDPYTPQNGVTIRVRRDYFMVGAGQTYATSGDIPVIPVQTYVGKLNPTFYHDPPQVVDNIGGSGGTTAGGVQYLESVPDKTTYFTWVANAAANGWSSGRVGTADANPGQIVISCKPERVMGNLWARVTRYVLAQ